LLVCSLLLLCLTPPAWPARLV